MSNNPTGKGTGFKRAFAQSTYITAAWNWFMILAGKAAEPVLVMSVLYASVKLLPIIHFAPQFDVAVFIAQFVALDVGGLSLNKLADQAKKDGNEEGAKQARRLSIALVAIMLTGVIMAGVDQVVKLDGQVGTVIDTILLIARAVMAVLYSRVIHSLKNDDEPERLSDQEIDDLINTKIESALQNALAKISEQLTALEAKQTQETGQLQAKLETAVLSWTSVPQRTPKTQTEPPKVRSISDAPSVKHAERDIDKVVWPLLNAGLTVRAIAERARTSTATVGRSRKRWDAAKKHAALAMSEDTPIDDVQEA